MASDVGETKDFAGQQPDHVQRMQVLFKDLIVKSGSAAGPDQKNDVKLTAASRLP